MSNVCVNDAEKYSGWNMEKSSSKRKRDNNFPVVKMLCDKCGYQWEPRTEQPKECPQCKRRLNHKNEEESTMENPTGYSKELEEKTQQVIDRLKDEKIKQEKQ